MPFQKSVVALTSRFRKHTDFIAFLQFQRAFIHGFRQNFTGLVDVGTPEVRRLHTPNETLARVASRLHFRVSSGGMSFFFGGVEFP
jgi:hypothetical protein